MHREVKDFVAAVRRLHLKHFENAHVLEVGSLDVNGSVRQFFSGCVYTGLDLTPGRGVDYVCHAKDWKKRGYYDTVISTEALEHDKHWQKTLRAMYAMTRPKRGLLVFTCAAPARAPHGTTQHAPEASPATNDWYRNISEDDVASVFVTLRDYFSDYSMRTVRNGEDLQFFGIKR